MGSNFLLLYCGGFGFHYFNVNLIEYLVLLSHIPTTHSDHHWPHTSFTFILWSGLRKMQHPRVSNGEISETWLYPAQVSAGYMIKSLFRSTCHCSYSSFSRN